MSIERLEKIEHFVDLIDFIPRDDRGMGEMDVNNVKNDMEWLIGRVRELEEELAIQKGLRKKCFFDLHKTKKMYGEAKNNYIRECKQNKHYREVLKTIYELAEYDEYDNTLEQIVSEVEKALEGEE